MRTWPLPRAKPRTAVQVDPLPRSALPHSFPLQVARVSLLQPLKMTLEELVWRMQDTKRYLVVDATNIFLTMGPQSGAPSPTLESHIPRFDPLLMKLATAMPDFGHVPFAREAVYSRICADFRRHIADPQQYPSPFGTDTWRGEPVTCTPSLARPGYCHPSNCQGVRMVER